MINFTAAATTLMLWGLIAHLIGDWLLQNEWMAVNKMNRRTRRQPAGSHLRSVRLSPWWDRHPAAYVHAGIHTALLLLVFPPAAAVAIGLSHFLIDLRWPVDWWSKLIRQTLPRAYKAVSADAVWPQGRPYKMEFDAAEMKVRHRFPDDPLDNPLSAEALRESIDTLVKDMQEWTVPVYDIGLDVRIWTDQVFHVACIAIAAVIVG